MDELRRTSRTVCHRLVTPLPSPPVEVRVVSLSTLQKREELISTKEPQAQRKDTHTYCMYPPRICIYRYIYIYIYTQSKTSRQTTTQQLVSKCDITEKHDPKNGFQRCGLFSFFLICQYELRGERPNVHLPSLVGQRPHQQHRM